MSIRIYALAKQLNVESKTLVDLCKKAGIEGKGSALASLTEEEVEQIRPLLQKQPASSGLRPDDSPQRPSSQVTSGKVPVLKPSLSKSAKSSAVESSSTTESTNDGVAEALPAQEKPSPSQTVNSPQSPVAVKSSEVPAVTVASTGPGASAPSPSRTSPLTAFLKRGDQGDAPAAQKEEPDSSSNEPIRTGLSAPGHVAAIRRDDYRSPMRSISDKIPSLDGRRKSTGEEGNRSPGSPAPKSGPTLRFAPVPKSPTVSPIRSKSEAAPQKPDMKLPPEAIRAAAEGKARPLADHIQKHEEKQRQTEDDKRGKKTRFAASPSGLPVESDEALKRGGVKKRGKEGVAVVSPLEHRKKKRHGSSRRNQGDDFGGDDVSSLPRRLVRRPKIRGVASSTAAPRKSDIVIQLPCSVKQFSEETGLSVALVIKKLIELGTPLMINSALDYETAGLLAEAFDLRADVRAERTLEDETVATIFDEEDDPDSLQPRPPIVTFLGHVDHGKTSLLDRILNLNVVSGEKGGITQHIRAYRITTPSGRDVTFVDTPGHEAFTEMRARGANVTDIAVLVVAADDGVMPQTEEAISHAKAAGVPIVVALNKIDLPGANPDKAVQELAANDLLPSEWGGDTEIVRCSALTGEGMDHLLDTLLMIAELHELKANPDRPAIGTALEAEMRAGEGVVCKAIVQNGTLKTGDVVLCGTAYGRVKAMYDTLDTKKQIDQASPATPVNLIGLDVAPGAGSKFCVLGDISVARRIAERRLIDERKSDLADARPQITLENLFQRLGSDRKNSTLNIIIRADVRGSIEAIKKELAKLEHPEVKIKILQATVGGITEADVQLADASEGIIVGFNVVPDENARSLADKRKVQIRRYDIIYNLAADIKAALEGMLKPIEQVKELGRALVQRVYSISRLGNIAGCRVLSGNIERDSRIRIVRESRIIGDYPLDSLKREKDDAKEVREGYECGIKLKNFNDLKEGDVLEAYKIEEIARTF